MTLGQLQREIFTPHCASCHTAGGSGPMPLTDAATSYAALVGVEPTNSAARDDGKKRVVPGDPAKSFLLHKVAGDLQFGEGDRMPPSSNPLSANQIALIRHWIEHGAPMADDQGNSTAGPGIITTIAGDGSAGYDGDNVPLRQARFYWPQDVCLDLTGRIFILDWNNHRLRMAPGVSGIIRTTIGSGLLGDTPSGPASEINLNHPTGVSVDNAGRLILAAWHNWKVKRLNANGMVETIAGTIQGYGGDGGPATAAKMDLPSSAEYDAAGNLYISDQGNRRIRKIDPSGIITTFAGTGEAGAGGDGGPAIEAQFNTIRGSDAVPCFKLAIDGRRLYITDSLNHRVRVIDLDTGIIRPFAGTGTPGYGGDGGPATGAALNFPTDVAIGPDHSVYICDSRNHAVRRVRPEGTITTVAGSGTKGYSGDGGQAGAARLNTPGGIYVDRNGRLFVADTINQRIRMVKLIP